MKLEKLIDNMINECPYLLRIQIERDKTLRKDVGEWLEGIIKVVWATSRERMPKHLQN